MYYLHEIQYRHKRETCKEWLKSEIVYISFSPVGFSQNMADIDSWPDSYYSL